MNKHFNELFLFCFGIKNLHQPGKNKNTKNFFGSLTRCMVAGFRTQPPAVTAAAATPAAGGRPRIKTKEGSFDSSFTDLPISNFHS